MNADTIARLPIEVRNEFYVSLSREEKEELAYRWPFWARPNQLSPSLSDEWLVWCILAGRGFGKSRSGAEWVRSMAENHPGCRIALVARTAADYRSVMVEGESGILAVCPPWNRPIWNPSKRELRWPNGSIATCYTSEKPDQLRGPQHHYAWLDEFAAWRFLEDTYSNLLMGLRLGDKPRLCITTTPRPVALLKEIAKDALTRVVTGRTHDNLVNLASTFRKVISRYEGTQLGRQELDGIILDDTAGALWTQKMVERALWKPPCDDSGNLVLPVFRRIVVAVDPAVTSNEDSDETGIIVAGIGQDDGLGYILEDLTLKGTPAEWTTVVIDAYRKYNADKVIAEVNNGGDLVESALRAIDKNVSFKAVRATRGKVLRAEPVASLYEQSKIRHIGSHAELEDQMTNWVPAISAKSPDRLDALVWALTELMLGEGKGVRHISTAVKQPSSPIAKF